MDVKFVAFILFLQAVKVYTMEPSCPDAALGLNILEHSVETNTIVKILQKEIADIREGLNRPALLFNKQVDNIEQNLTVLHEKLEGMKAKLDKFETKLTKGI